MVTRSILSPVPLWFLSPVDSQQVPLWPVIGVKIVLFTPRRPVLSRPDLGQESCAIALTPEVQTETGSLACCCCLGCPSCWWSKLYPVETPFAGNVLLHSLHALQFLPSLNLKCCLSSRSVLFPVSCETEFCSVNSNCSWHHTARFVVVVVASLTPVCPLNVGFFIVLVCILHLQTRDKNPDLSGKKL